MTDDRRANPRLPVALLVRVSASDATELAQRFATNLSRGGVFLRVRDEIPLGTELKLEIQLSDGRSAIRALGIVRFVRPDKKGAQPPVNVGIGVQFLEMDAESRALVDEVVRIAAERAAAPKPMAPLAPPEAPPTRVPPPEQPATPAPPPIPPSTPGAEEAHVERAPAPAMAPAEAPTASPPPPDAPYPAPAPAPAEVARPPPEPEPEGWFGDGSLPPPPPIETSPPPPPIETSPPPAPPAAPVPGPEPVAPTAAAPAAPVPGPEPVAPAAAAPAAQPAATATATAEEDIDLTVDEDLTEPAPPSHAPPGDAAAAVADAKADVASSSVLVAAELLAEAEGNVVVKTPSLSSAANAPSAIPSLQPTPGPAPAMLARITTHLQGPMLSRDTLGLPGLDPKFEPERSGPVIGIDLGTTYSCAAFVRGGKAQTLPSREGYSTIPSVVALSNKARLLVGHPARRQMLTNPEQTVYGSKRLIGRPFNSPLVTEIRDRFYYEICEGPAGQAAVRLGGTVLTLQEISALLLKEVREIAQDALCQPLHRAIITCPAYYNDLQRAAVREAGRLAGLYVERIVNEPTAAALAFGYGKGVEKRILIYDLGGGTFDASLLELHDTVFEVISTGGDVFLGGVDFDNALVDLVMHEFQQKTGKQFVGDRIALQRLTDACERAKLALSERDTFRIHVPFVTHIDGQPYDVDVSVTREQFEGLVSPLVDRTISVCAEVLEAKGISPQQIDEIVLVGGSSRMPLVRSRLKQFFGKDAHKGVHPDEAVALGAALLAHSLERAEGVVLIDVLPMSIGVGLPGGRFKKIVERNSSLPVTKTYEISNARDNQTSVEMQIFQGESDKATENEFLGTLTVADLPKAKRGTLKINVTFHLTSECILTVKAEETGSKTRARATMSTKSTPEEVRKKLGLKPPQANEALAVPGLAGSDGKVSVARKKTGVLGFLKGLFGKS